MAFQTQFQGTLNTLFYKLAYLVLFLFLPPFTTKFLSPRSISISLTFHLDLAKFFFSCSDTEAWMLRSPLAPVILRIEHTKFEQNNFIHIEGSLFSPL